MKKNILKIFAFLISASFCLHAFAAEKVRVIDMNSVFGKTNYAQEQYKKVEASEAYQAVIKNITDQRKKLQNLQKEAETKSLTWSDEQKQAHRQKMQGELNFLNQLGNQQEAMNLQVNAEIEKALLPKVEKIVNAIIKEKGIGLLLNSRAVYFGSPEFDITNEVIKRLNSEK